MQNMHVPPEVADIFPPAAVVGVCAFAVAGVFSAVAPEFLGNELGDKSPVHAGLLVSLFFAMSVSGQLTVNWIPKRRGLAVGCVVLIAGLGLLAAALATRSTVLLFLSAAVSSGLGQGLPVGFGLSAINEKVGDKRGETDSAYFVLLYGGVALPVVGVGLVALAGGMVTAGLLSAASSAPACSACSLSSWGWRAAGSNRQRLWILISRMPAWPSIALARS